MRGLRSFCRLTALSAPPCGRGVGTGCVVGHEGGKSLSDQGCTSQLRAVREPGSLGKAQGVLLYFPRTEGSRCEGGQYISTDTGGKGLKSLWRLAEMQVWSREAAPTVSCCTLWEEGQLRTLNRETGSPLDFQRPCLCRCPKQSNPASRASF